MKRFWINLIGAGGLLFSLNASAQYCVPPGMTCQSIGDTCCFPGGEVNPCALSMPCPTFGEMRERGRTRPARQSNDCELGISCYDPCTHTKIMYVYGNVCPAPNARGCLAPDAYVDCKE